MGKQTRQDLFGSESGSSTQSPVECMGMKFPNDEARRAYFTDKLREKLKDAAFRKIEGFPIGTDEDILALSDPPYYTACPNPFLMDIIRSKSHATSTRGAYNVKPFASDVTEGKNDLIYNAHPYHTKVPPKALMRLLLHYTQPGDVVLDAFCGSGMTGVAASLCEDPKQHLGRYEGTPGVRYAVLSDLSPLATFIANVNSRPKLTGGAFTELAASIARTERSQWGWMYKTRHSTAQSKNVFGDILYTIWSEYYRCTNCDKEILAWDALIDRKQESIRKVFKCPSCSAELIKDQLERITETYFDSLIQCPATRNKSIPVWIHYKLGSSRYEKAPDADDIELLRRIDAATFPTTVQGVKMNFRDSPWGDLYRAGYHAGVTHVHHFFTKRNLLALTALRDSAQASPYSQEMLYVLTGFVDNHSSKRNRYLVDQHHPNGTTCGPLSNSLYIPELQCEVNPFNTWEKTLKKEAKAFAVSRQRCSFLTTESSRLASVPEASIDYIFIDPPFGENIFYSESSFCWEYFLRVYTNAKEEAIISKMQGKTVADYELLIQNVMAECYRVLRPGRWMTVEFSNRSNKVWNAIGQAIQACGFVVADVRVFDKQHGTIRQDAGQSVKKDLIISCYKPGEFLEFRFSSEAGTEEGVWDFVTSHLMQLPVTVIVEEKLEVVAERKESVLFDRTVAFHVQRGYSIPLSASEFYAKLRQKFPERDGMYFLPDQVSEYDHMRLSTKEVEQLQLFVNDEKSAIQWVRRQLTDQPITYQELSPLYMKEAQRVWEKHEKPLELLIILEQNFIKNSDNTWRIPDPKKEADLEQLRHRMLMKEFQQYLDNKVKLKVVRTEALRAGFKECWQKKDYTTIVQMAKRVPEAVIQEDQALLMYFDNALLLKGD